MSGSEPDCAFCRIVAGTLPATHVYSDDLVVAIQDRHPVAPVHVLVIPRRHVPDVTALGPEDGELLGRMFAAANQVAHELGVAASGYRLVINRGPHAGQTVDHLHLHMLGGRPMGWPPG